MWTAYCRVIVLCKASKPRGKCWCASEHKNMNPIEFNPQILWQKIKWWKVKHPIFFFNIVSKLRYDLFYSSTVCFVSQDFQFGSLPCPIFCLSWLLANRQEGVKNNDGDTRWCVLRSQNVSQSDDCHSVGFLFLTLAHLLVSTSLSLSLSLSLPAVEAGFKRISFEFSLPQGPQLKPCLSVWVFRRFKGQWWNKPPK